MSEKQQPELEKNKILKFELGTPLVDGDTVHKELTLDFSRLNVRSLIAVESDLATVMPAHEIATMVLKSTNFAYQMVVAAKAANIPPHVILDLNGADALNIAGQVQGFLLSRG